MEAQSLTQRWWAQLIDLERTEREAKIEREARLPVYAKGGYHPWSAVAGAMIPIPPVDWEIYRKKTIR